MKFSMGVFCLMAFLACAKAQAIPMGFEFYQEGFANGATVSGHFMGEDLDGNGQLSSFLGEISGFQLSYSGDGYIPAFELGFADLFGLVYDLGSGFLGDGLDDHIEGILAWNGNALYGVGPGPLWNPCGTGQICSLVGNRDWLNFSCCLNFAISSHFLPWISAVAFLVGNLKTYCPDQIFLVNFSIQRHDKFINMKK